MRALTHQVWAEHYVSLRQHVLERWPRVDRQELEAIADDYDGLVELVQRATNLSAEDVHRELRNLEVPELGIGPGDDRDEDLDETGGRASLAQLRLGQGFADAERERVTQRLEKLNRRLKRFPADGTDLLITVKDRDDASQKVTLEAQVPRYAPFVATSDNPDLRTALNEVRDELWRQIDDAVQRRRKG
jgi:ribosome-associated translation inhibitor RaiA